MTEPTTAELARRLDREYSQLREEMQAGFTRIERAIERQRYVDPELFRADQLRQDDATADLRGKVAEIGDDVGAVREAMEQSVGTLRTQFTSGLLIVLVVAVVAAILTR